MPGSHLRIENPGLHPRTAKFFLDGNEVRGLKSLSIEFDCDKITVATLTIRIDGLEIDAQAMLCLQAEYEARQGDGKTKEWWTTELPS